MRSGSYVAAALAAGLCAGCEPAGVARGASSPRALLDRLVGSLAGLARDRFASCFDPQSAEGRWVAGVGGRALDVLERARALEASVREAYGARLADERMAFAGPLLYVARLRERLGQGRLVVAGDAARLELGAAPVLKLYARGGAWYLVTPPPFAGDEALQRRVSGLVELLARHVARATRALAVARSEAGYREALVTIGEQTSSECAPEIASLLDELRQRGWTRQ